MKTKRFGNLLEKARLNLDIVILPVAFILVVVLMTLSTNFKFLTYGNISSILLQLPELGLFTLAMMLAMAVGGINLSIISTSNLAGVIMAWLMVNVISPEASGVGLVFQLVLVVLCGLAVSLVLGAINGILIAYVEVSPTLATLSTMILYEGLTLAITKGKVISGLPEMFVNMSNGKFLGIPTPFYFFVAIAFLVRVMIKKSSIGKYQIMIGANKNATMFSGINTRKVLMQTYMISSLLSGIAGVIMISRYNSANARFGTSYMLLAVLTSVLGGTDPNGGYVRVGGVIAALFTIQALNSGINILGVSSFVSTMLWGLLLVAIIAYRQGIAKYKEKYLSGLVKKAEAEAAEKEKAQQDTALSN